MLSFPKLFVLLHPECSWIGQILQKKLSSLGLEQDLARSRAPRGKNRLYK